jgi:cobalt-zinc-cadmium efflux system outer membrane protein
MSRIKFFAFFILVCNGFCSFGQSPLPYQDTVSLGLSDAERLFLQNNFQLLAAKYNVNAADAAIIQAKLIPNPNLSIDQGAYNHETNKWFDVTHTGETAISLQQLILLGGKRNKQISLAKINSRISIYQFYELIRTLRYELHSSFYSLYFTRQSLAVYDREIQSLKSLVDAYSDQYNKGNVAFKELARLQALEFDLQIERNDLLKDATEKQSNLSLLTGDTLLRPIKPVMQQNATGPDPALLNYTQLVDSGLTNRYDLLTTEAQVNLYETNLRLQKAMRVPDLTVGANWDRQGSYITNYNSVSLAMDLPFWNHNKGNIHAAEYQLDASRQLETEASMQVKADITKAFSQLVEADRLYKSASKQFSADYEKLLDGITIAYVNHTISMLEFIDYYETYKNSKIDFNKLQNNRLDAMENLNYATGTAIVK